MVLYNFKLRDHILFTIDYKSISVVNKNNGNHVIINYPDAAVWSILTENHNKEKTTLMLKSVLGKSKSDTMRYIGKCLRKWKELEILQ
jgi:hypothetical protein